MALTDKLTAIANAIRKKTSVTDKLTLDLMPGYIESITTVDIDTEGIDQGVVDEANRVAGEILKKMSSNSITFIAISDMHEMGDSDHTDSSIINEYRLANKHAGQGVKLIAQKIGVDFFANLGDLAFGTYRGDSPTTAYDLFKSVEAAKSYIDTAAFPKTITVPGNHDSAFSWTDASGNHITDDYVAAAIGNYQYIDFENKRVRVIALNTAERIASANDPSVGNMTNEQLLWFANALNLSSKSNPSMWQIIILSHHPFGTKYLPSAANVLQAYVNGSKITIGSQSYDFKGKNAAKIVGNFHGHTHCFKVANIDTIPEERKILRIAIPNACNGRNNEYGRDGDLVYGESTTCPTNKTNGRKSTIAGQDTAFCVVTINLDEQKIYAYCFGSLGDTTPGTHAGYDREISYVNEQTYNITNNLTGASSDNSASIITKGSKYTATISALIDYEIDSIIVTMGGIDITSSAVIGNNITIEEVTGDIVITVTTNIVEDFEYGTFANLVERAEERDSTAIYNNGDGYKNSVYPNEAGDVTSSGVVCTGFIPYTWSPDNVLYIKGATLNTSNQLVRIYGFNSKTDVNDSVGYTEGSLIDERFTVKQLGNNYYKLTPKTSASSVQYIRISLLGTVTGKNLIVTVNEQIHASNGESGDPDVAYKNRVTTSIGTDYEVYNGGNGYKTGYRFKSSGEEQESTNSIISGFIPYNNEVIRAYGTTTERVGESGNYIVFYNSSFTKTVVIAFNTLASDGATWEQVDGKYMLTCNPTTLKNNASYFADAAYIRVGFASMSNAANFVVTLDEPIV